MISVEIDPKTIYADVDDATRTVFLSEAPLDLAQVGIDIGAIVSVINGTSAYDFIADADARGEGALSREPMEWVFVAGERRIRLTLVFKDSVTPSVEVIAQAPAAHPAPASDVPDPGPGAPRAELIRIRLTTPFGEPVSVDVDKSARTVVLGKAAAELAPAGVAVGAVCISINGQPPYEFLEGGLRSGEVLQWIFAVGEETVRLELVFTAEPALSVFSPGEILMGDNSHRVRPPRPMAVNWRGWWAEPEPR